MSSPVLGSASDRLVARLHAPLFDLELSGESAGVRTVLELLGTSMVSQAQSSNSGRCLRLESVAQLPPVPADARQEYGGSIKLAFAKGGVWYRAPGYEALIEPTLGRLQFVTTSEFDAQALKERIDWIGISLLHLLRAQGVSSLHASAVRSPYGAVVMAGNSGSGKSTTAGSLSRYGWPRIADDIVLLAPGTPAAVSALVFGAAYWADSAERLDLTAPTLLSEQGRRIKHFAAGAGLPGQHACAALVFPQVTGHYTRLQRLSPAEALLRVFTTVGGIVADSQHAHAQLQGLRRWLNQVPAFAWQLAEDSFGNGALLAQQIDAQLGVSAGAPREVRA